MSDWNLCPQCGRALGDNAPKGIARCAGHGIVPEQDPTRRLAYAIYRARAIREKHPTIAQSFDQLTQEAQQGYLQEARAGIAQMEKGS
jgi:hypothetical protein